MKIKVHQPVFNHEDDGTTECGLWGEMELHGIKKDLYGQEFSYKEKIDEDDEELGRGLSYVRALKDWANCAENWLIQQSCVKFNETRIKAKEGVTSNIGDMTVKLNLNTNQFKQELKNLEKLCSVKYGQWNETKSEPNQTLKSLVGKWAIRTKPVIKEDGDIDYSYMDVPLLIIWATDNYFGAYASQYGFSYSGKIIEQLRKDTSFKADFNRYGEEPFFDNNWKEYKEGGK